MRDKSATHSKATPAFRRPGTTSRNHPPPLGARCALFLDIDGTLLDLAAAPNDVRVDVGIAALLPALARRLGGAVALITGRSIVEADRLFPGSGLPIAGLHGLERRTADGAVHRYDPKTDWPQPLRHDLSLLADRHAGLLLEDKGATLALHYRRAPQLASHVHRAVRASLQSSTGGRGWRLQPGKRVVEIGPDGRDKGTAIDEYLAEAPFTGRLPIFVGDDLSDEVGFTAVARAGGWAVKVGRGRTAARYRLPDVAAVRRWLTMPDATACPETSRRNP